MLQAPNQMNTKKRPRGTGINDLASCQEKAYSTLPDHEALGKGELESAVVANLDDMGQKRPKLAVPEGPDRWDGDINPENAVCASSRGEGTAAHSLQHDDMGSHMKGVEPHTFNADLQSNFTQADSDVSDSSDPSRCQDIGGKVNNAFASATSIQLPKLYHPADVIEAL